MTVEHGTAGTPQVLSSSTLMGDPVVNVGEEELGTVKEVMIDVGAGRVAYVVITRGGVMGMGDKLFAVPWRLVTVDGDRHRLILDVDAETLDNSPGFDQDNWPTFNDTEWGTDLHEHYGVDPYWETERTPPLT